jgi:polyisoprenoid-binding protein YceI
VTIGLLLASWQIGLCQAQVQQSTYSVVPNESTLTILVGKAGALRGLGHEHVVAARSFSGEAHIPANALNRASFAFELDTGSLSVADQGISDKDRMEIERSMKEKVLEVSRFPKINFQSVSITDIQPTTNGQNALLNGGLTLHGVTRQVRVPAALSVTPQQLRVSGDVMFNQTDFGIKPYSTAAGTIKVRNELKIRFSVIARPSTPVR